MVKFHQDKFNYLMSLTVFLMPLKKFLAVPRVEVVKLTWNKGDDVFYVRWLPRSFQGSGLELSDLFPLEQVLKCASIFLKCREKPEGN